MAIQNFFAKLQAERYLQWARECRLEASREDLPYESRLFAWQQMWCYLADAAASRREAMSYPKD